MSRALITEGYLTDIADAIRAKNGSSDAYTPSQMAAAIQELDTSGIHPTGTKQITTNGAHDVTEYASANVAVVPNLQSKIVTQNGTVTPDQGYDGLSSVVVNVSGGGGGGSVVPDYQGLSYAFITGSNFNSWTTQTNYMLFFPVSKNKKYVIFKENSGNRLRAVFFSNKTYADFEYYVNNGQSQETIYTGDSIMDAANNAVCSIYTPSTDGILVLMTDSQSRVITGYCIEM